MKIKKPTLPKVKMNMVVGKRQIVLAALVMGLGCAVYLNWEYTKMDTNIDTVVAETGKNYGDAQFVSSEEEDAYFAEAKLSRTSPGTRQRKHSARCWQMPSWKPIRKRNWR